MTRVAQRKPKASAPSSRAYDPAFARAIVRSSLYFVPGAFVSTVVMGALVALELTLISSAYRILVAAGAMLAVFHVSYAVNTAMQFRIAIVDFDRCVRGVHPHRFTPEYMAKAIHSVKSGKRRPVSPIARLLIVGTPFFSVASWAIGEIFALHAKEIHEHVANLSESEHRINRFLRTDREGRTLVRTSKDVVIRQAGTVHALGAT